MYTIKRAAELTGISEATLRAWERRYGVVTPLRSSGGYRLYDDHAVTTLRRMSSLVSTGWTPAQAALEVRGEAGAPNRAASAAATSSITSNPGSRPFVTGTEPDDSATSALLDAARALDAEKVAAILDRQLSAARFETVVDSWLLPMLATLGQAWRDKELDVAGEHLVAQAVMRRLASIYEAAPTNLGAPRVLLALPPGADHELGLMSFAVAARRAGLHTTYLGRDLPQRSWRQAVLGHRPDCLVTAVTTATEVRSLTAMLAELDADPVISTRVPPIDVAIGGRLQDSAPKRCLRLGHNVGDGAAALAARLTVTSPPA